jgi:putative membrane-bound dehydrogenase-like protein
VKIFSTEVPPAQQAHIDRYTRDLTDKLEQASLAALADRKPARLSWAVGSAGFGRNRRAAWGGPVDHSLPVMFVHSPEGKLRAVFANYACHATTLQFNKVHGDWPGTAMQAIQRDHPGVVALIALGCGADQNPNPRGTMELTVQHGEEVAAEVSRLLKSERKPIRGKLDCQAKDITLPLAPLPSREEWEKRAAITTPNISYIAQKNLARLGRGEKLPTELPYRVETWNFGDDLAMVFLPGEVTVDYELRLKVDYDPARLWVNGYSNDALCYIPSERILKEGGYEGETAMVYYDRPNKFAPGVEDRIIGAVHDIMPKPYLASYRADVPPKSPSQSMAAIKLRDGLAIELMAAEPFVMDPVAIDWDAQGRLWVVEQPDYPNGMDGKMKPGGRVKILTDTDGDGRFDKATLFLEGIPFPTGVTCWRGGALVCAAPDILYAEDTDGDGKADKVEKLFTGFYTDNYNARINSLSLGLDNWVHGANGLLGGKIRSEKTGVELDIRGHDIRFQPDTGIMELVPGPTQQGLARDDWDNWFGCSNSRWIFHFPFPEEAVSRNPHVAAPAPSVYLPTAENQGELNPASRPLERFNHPDAFGHITSACGLGIYRDVLLGKEFQGNAFIGEVAHNLVRRYRLDPKGATFEARRPDDEAACEFLASADNWTRPVQIRTGRDGALYVVDMYRAVIEHTRWIPADRLAKIDVRAGDTMGRIYRIFPRGVKLRPVADLTKLDGVALAAALDTPNGTTRDLVHQLLLQRNDAASQDTLVKLATSSRLPAVRVQALAVLGNAQPVTAQQGSINEFFWDHNHLRLETPLLIQALQDRDAPVRRQAVRLCEKRLVMPELAEACLRLASDPDFTVRYEVALVLGGWDEPRATKALAEMGRKDMADAGFRAALVSSSVRHPLDVLDVVMTFPAKSEGRASLIASLIATAAASAEKPSDFERLLNVLALDSSQKPAAWQLAGMAQLQDTLDRRKLKLASLSGADKVRGLYARTHDLASDPKANDSERALALRLFGRGFNEEEADLPLLVTFLNPSMSDSVQKAALATLAKTSSPKVADAVLSDWTQRAPSLRASIITTLLSREAWAKRLLQAVADKVVSPAEISTSSQGALLKHPNAAIRKQAADLLPKGGAGERAKVVAKYQSVATLHGDAVKGATVFKNVCSVCHSYLGQGMAVGPDPKAYYDKSISDFVTAILNPNAAVEPRYAAYAVTLRDGRALTGVIANETATNLEVVQPGGIRESVLRTDLREIRAIGLSLMPDGLEQAITPQDMADLIAYLKSGG